MSHELRVRFGAGYTSLVLGLDFVPTEQPLAGPAPGEWRPPKNSGHANLRTFWYVDLFVLF